MKIQPTAAWYLSHVLPVFHKQDRLYLPIHRFPQVEILLFLSVHKILHPAVSEEADPPVPVQRHIPDNVRSELVLPSISDGRIPSHAACSLQLHVRFLFLR